jgi:predicted CoA-substrate-specific enzyme activase
MLLDPSTTDPRVSRLLAGLDLGSVATKAVVWRAEQGLLAASVVPTGWRPRESADRALSGALAAAHVASADLAGLGVTGYGRDLFPDALARATEVTCQARGVHHFFPAARTIIDIGGQDTKVLRADEFGNAVDFVLNDRCAAGTGRFLEVMARALGMSLSDLGEAAASAPDALAISSTCTVFAESEVVGLVARGEPRDAIAAGLCAAIARQVVTLAARLGLEHPVAVVGGVARNAGVRRALAAQLVREPLVPDHPQFTAALGAALFAQEVLSQS